MQKDFKKWHEKKSHVNAIPERPFFHERGIWFCYVGVNIGFEQDGGGDEFLRPVLVVRKFNNSIFWGVPLTKVQKRLKKRAEQFYFDFSFIDGVRSSAILSQLRLIDARRLSRHIGTMNDEEFLALTEKLKALLP